MWLVQGSQWTINICKLLASWLRADPKELMLDNMQRELWGIVLDCDG